MSPVEVGLLISGVSGTGRFLRLTFFFALFTGMGPLENRLVLSLALNAAALFVLLSTKDAPDKRSRCVCIDLFIRSFESSTPEVAL